MLLHVNPLRLLHMQANIRQNTEVLSFTIRQGLHPKALERATNHGYKVLHREGQEGEKVAASI